MISFVYLVEVFLYIKCSVPPFFFLLHLSSSFHPFCPQKRNFKDKKNFKNKKSLWKLFGSDIVRYFRMTFDCGLLEDAVHSSFLLDSFCKNVCGLSHETARDISQWISTSWELFHAWLTLALSSWSPFSLFIAQSLSTKIFLWFFAFV